jgi:FlaG/FlaF family flagellin (archaellin)
MNRISILLILILSAHLASAQKFSIKGQVIDSLLSPMPSATIMLLNPKDSSLVNFGLSDSNGFFEIKNVNKGEYDLKITFMGYASFSKRVDANGTSPIIDAGELKLQPQAKMLNEMVIMGERVPVRIKGDTIEFNASSFKTKANANVEDLLKKLPGVEVDPDGTVRAQGEEVKKVLVDGKEFFGRDPKLATRNLPADAIDKVQVFDKKSDQAEFTGIEDGQREKTVNLELKEDKRNGMFGNASAGVGTEERYQLKANINRFRKDQQLSFLGMGNNINEQGFSINDYMNFTGGSQQMMSGGGGAVRLTFDSNNSNGVPMNFGGRQSGIMTNYAGGVNFNKDLSKKTQLTSSYFYNRLDQNIIKYTDRINYLPPDSSYNFNQASRQLSNNDNHRVNITIDHKIDSANTLKFANNFTYSDSEMNSNTASTTTTEDGTVQNESVRNNYSAQTSSNLNSSLLWRHRFSKKGRTLSTNVTLGLTQTDGEGSQDSQNHIYTGVPEDRNILQTNTQKNDNQSYGATVSYTEPLGGRKYLEANYNFRTNMNSVVRDVFDIQSGQEVFNTLLSSEYNSNYVYNRPGLNFRINREKYSLTVGASYQMTSLKGDLISLEKKIDRQFENALPSAHFNYDFSTYKHFRLDYETSMQEPTIQQLQPVVNNTDPFNLTLGNPNLGPAYNHQLNLNYTTFDPGRFINLFAFVTATYTSNAIANSQTVDPGTFVRVTIPVNVNNNVSLNGNFNFGFPIKPLNSRFNFGPTVTYSNGVSILQGQENNIKKQTLGGTVRYNYTYKEILTIDLSANLSHQQTLYDFSTPDQVYFNQTYTNEANLNFLKNYQFNAVFEYLIYNSQTTDYNQTIPLLSMSISRFILKNNSGEIKIGVNNLLDKSLSVTQTASDNYLQQETTNNLGRYYMVSFTYAINKHLNPMGGRRGGGGMRMIMRP